MSFGAFPKGKVPRSVADPVVVQIIWVTMNTPMIFAYNNNNNNNNNNKFLFL